jgi:hypothetical protein
MCSAAAQVAVESGHDRVAGRMAVLAQQGGRRHQDARHAVPALAGLQLEERGLEAVWCVLGSETLECLDLG